MSVRVTRTNDGLIATFVTQCDGPGCKNTTTDYVTLGWRYDGCVNGPDSSETRDFCSLICHIKRLHLDERDGTEEGNVTEFQSLVNSFNGLSEFQELVQTLRKRAKICKGIGDSYESLARQDLSSLNQHMLRLAREFQGRCAAFEECASALENILNHV